MIKLVACDLDGTLFNSEMKVSPGNASAIKEAQAKGIEFLVATGRAPRESQKLMADADLKTGFINLNGALVYDQAGNLVIKHVISKKKAAAIVKLLREQKFYFEIVSGHHVYSENLNERIANVAHVNADLNPGMSFKEAVAISAGNKSIMNISKIANFDQLLRDPKKEILKIIAYDSRGQVAFEDLVPAIRKLGQIVVTSSSANNIEINDEKAQKGLALLDYAKIKGIKIEQTAAIGDNLNDESMIRLAGTGVAMENAVPRIKHLAQAHTKDNNHDGVAWILKKFMADNKGE